MPIKEKSRSEVNGETSDRSPPNRCVWQRLRATVEVK